MHSCHSDMQFARPSVSGAPGTLIARTRLRVEDGEKNKGKIHSPLMCFRAFAFSLGQTSTHELGTSGSHSTLGVIYLPHDRWARPFASSERFQLNASGQGSLDLFMPSSRRPGVVSASSWHRESFVPASWPHSLSRGASFFRTPEYRKVKRNERERHVVLSKFGCSY